MKYCAPLSKCIWLRMFTSTWPRRRQLSCNEKSYKQCTKRSPPYRNSYWFDNYSIWRWESQTQQPPTSTTSARCCLSTPPKGLTSKKKLKPLPSSTRHSPRTVWSKTWIKQLVKSSLRIFAENWWDSPSTSRQKPIIRLTRSTDTVDQDNKLIELIEIIADKKRGETDNGRSLEHVNQANSAPIAEKPVKIFLTVGRSIWKRVVGDPSGIKHNLTRLVDN